MKHLLIVILLFLTANCYSQFNASAGIDGGLRLNNATSEFNNQYDLNATVGYLYEKFNFGIQSRVYISDKQVLPLVVTGINIQYPLMKLHYNTDENGQHELYISGHWLYGSQGTQLIGGGLSYALDCSWNVNADFSQEYLSKDFYGSLGVSYSFLE